MSSAADRKLAPRLTAALPPPLPPHPPSSSAPPGVEFRELYYCFCSVHHCFNHYLCSQLDCTLWWCQEVKNPLGGALLALVVLWCFGVRCRGVIRCVFRYRGGPVRREKENIFSSAKVNRSQELSTFGCLFKTNRVRGDGRHVSPSPRETGRRRRVLVGGDEFQRRDGRRGGDEGSPADGLTP